VGVELEITPQPTDLERAAIEAALGEEADAERASAWADEALPKRDQDFET
jgi:hypothetical protein